jgi:hypothetical protein
MTGLGLLLLSRQQSVGIVLMIAGLGSLAQWLPFDWGRPAPASDDPCEWAPIAVEALPPSAAILAAVQLMPSVFSLAPKPLLTILFLSAVMSLVVFAMQVWTNLSARTILRLLSAMALCGLVADVARLNHPGPLSIDIIGGTAAAMAVWFHGVAILLIWNASRAGSGSQARLISRLAAADLAGAPPLPGFWLRGLLLISVVSCQDASNITGEFEPNTAMIALTLLLAITWGVLMAAIARNTV